MLHEWSYEGRCHQGNGNRIVQRRRYQSLAPISSSHEHVHWIVFLVVVVVDVVVDERSKLVHHCRRDWVSLLIATIAVLAGKTWSQIVVVIVLIVATLLEHDIVHCHLIFTVLVFVDVVLEIALLVTLVQEIDLLDIQLGRTVQSSAAKIWHRSFRQNRRLSIARECVLAVVHHRHEVVWKSVVGQVVVFVLFKVSPCR